MPFAKSGSDIISFHIEALGKSRHARLKKAHAIIQDLKKLKVRPAVALNPSTPLADIKDLLDKLDWVLVMSVNPGFGGQEFIPAVLPKIFELRQTFAGDIEVDGGINEETAREVVRSGANLLAAGTYLFKAHNMEDAIRRLKNDE